MYPDGESTFKLHVTPKVNVTGYSNRDVGV